MFRMTRVIDLHWAGTGVPLQVNSLLCKANLQGRPIWACSRPAGPDSGSVLQLPVEDDIDLSDVELDDLEKDEL